MPNFAQKPPSLAFSAIGLIVYHLASFRCVIEEISLYRDILRWRDTEDFVYPLNLCINLPFESLASSDALFRVLKYSFCLARIKETLSKNSLGFILSFLP